MSLNFIKGQIVNISKYIKTFFPAIKFAKNKFERILYPFNLFSVNLVFHKYFSLCKKKLINNLIQLQKASDAYVSRVHETVYVNIATYF